MRLARFILPLAFSALVLGGCGGGKGRAGTTSTAGAPASTSTARASTSTSPSGASATPKAPAGGISPASREVSPGVVRASADGLSATMHASGHRPRANRPWPVSFDVSKAGRPIGSEVRYQYLFAGRVVAHRSHYRFHGSFHDTFIWPDSAVGYPLTFRAVIGAGGTTLNLDYDVQVQR